MRQPLDVLIVDDCDVMRLVIRRTLDLCPFETDRVIEAANGDIGLYWAKNIKFDLIIADLNMPKMSGSEMIANIRVDREFNDTPILAVSAESNESRVSVINGLTDGYVHKPFTPEILRDEILKVLQKRTIINEVVME